MSNPKITVSIVLDDETMAWLEQRAKQEDRSVSSLVRTIVAGYREWLARGGQPAPEVKGKESNQ